MVTISMSCLMTGGPGKEHGTNKPPPTGRVQERSKGDTTCPTTQSHSPNPEATKLLICLKEMPTPPWGPWSNHPPSCVEWDRKEWQTCREEELNGEGSAAGEQEVLRGEQEVPHRKQSARNRRQQKDTFHGPARQKIVFSW